MGAQLERDIFKLFGLGITAVVVGNIIVNWRGTTEIIKATGGAYTGILRELRR